MFQDKNMCACFVLWTHHKVHTGGKKSWNEGQGICMMRSSQEKLVSLTKIEICSAFKFQKWMDTKIKKARWKTIKTRRSENDNTPQPLDQWTKSPFIGQQVGNCKRFTLTHCLADLFAMHRGPRSISLCIQHHIQLTSLSFQVSRPSHS